MTTLEKLSYMQKHPTPHSTMDTNSHPVPTQFTISSNVVSVGYSACGLFDDMDNMAHTRLHNDGRSSSNPSRSRRRASISSCTSSGNEGSMTSRKMVRRDMTGIWKTVCVYQTRTKRHFLFASQKSFPQEFCTKHPSPVLQCRRFPCCPSRWT